MSDTTDHAAEIRKMAEHWDMMGITDDMRTIVVHLDALVHERDSLDTALREARASRERWISLTFGEEDLHERWNDLIEAGEVVKHGDGVTFGYELIEDGDLPGDADGEAS